MHSFFLQVLDPGVYMEDIFFRTHVFIWMIPKFLMKYVTFSIKHKYYEFYTSVRLDYTTHFLMNPVNSFCKFQIQFSRLRTFFFMRKFLSGWFRNVEPKRSQMAPNDNFGYPMCDTSNDDRISRGIWWWGQKYTFCNLGSKNGLKLAKWPFWLFFIRTTFLSKMTLENPFLNQNHYTL